MKKSLLIILSMFLMSMAAHAVGVDCWEEYTQAYYPEIESKMKAILGNDVAIVKVATKAKAFIHNSSTSHNVELFFPKDAISFKKTSNNKDLFPAFQYNSSYDSDGFNDIGYKASVASRAINSTVIPDIEQYPNTDQATYLKYGDASSSVFSLSLFYGTFIHTFCIANTNSGGGGGGAAGAAVNYIIKAN